MIPNVCMLVALHLIYMKKKKKTTSIYLWPLFLVYEQEKRIQGFPEFFKIQFMSAQIQQSKIQHSVSAIFFNLQLCIFQIYDEVISYQAITAGFVSYSIVWSSWTLHQINWHHHLTQWYKTFFILYAIYCTHVQDFSIFFFLQKSSNNFNIKTF